MMCIYVFAFLFATKTTHNNACCQINLLFYCCNILGRMFFFHSLSRSLLDFAICYNYTPKTHRIGMTNIYVILLVFKILRLRMFFCVRIFSFFFSFSFSCSLLMLMLKFRADDAINHLKFYYVYEFGNLRSFPFL